MTRDDENDSMDRDSILPDLVQLHDETARNEFLDANTDLVRADVVEWLTEVVRRQARIDVRDTLAIADFTVNLAGRLSDPAALAQSIRAKANALYIAGE